MTHHALFTLEKQPATGSRGMVVSNHPLASAAGSEIMLSGGNAIDAAIATLFALTVVEPMMVSVLGGGVMHIRKADGRHVVIDCLSTAPGAAKPDMFRPATDGKLPNARGVEGRKNEIGALAVAVPGALAGWCQAIRDHGRLALAEVMAPAIRLAEQGFVVTPYFSDCIKDSAADLKTDPALAALFLPGGEALKPGDRLVQKNAARSLRLIAEDGAQTLYGQVERAPSSADPTLYPPHPALSPERRGLLAGRLGDELVTALQSRGGILAGADLQTYAPIVRQPIRATYRGYEIIGPPPPASSGVHIAQMLNILEHYDLKAMGFGSPDACHLLAETLKIAFADRAVATADPDFVKVPVEKLTSKAYATERRSGIRMDRAQSFSAGLSAPESADTTHVTIADAEGNVVTATQTLNSLFGACVTVGDTGLLANNYMFNFDPFPGRALSIAPGKRCFTSMSPMMVVKDGKVLHALGLPGGLRIFPSALQAVINLIDHGMSTQQAVEAPRLWTEGGILELEPAFPAATAETLEARGHRVQRVNRVAGGMNAVSFAADGTMTGAACWRADGTPVGIAGGLARAGVRFTLG
jgi:gamma-glutamyltranspeptidase / glutathione hydrolase